MTPRCDLVALGDPVLDLLLISDELPRWDDKHLGRAARWASGGCEANAACAAARLGLRCALLAVASIAQAPGARLAVEVERAVLDETGMPEALGQGPDVLCFNAAGFRSFTGQWAIDEALLHRALGQVRAEAIVVTLGEGFAIGLDRGSPAVHQCAWPARVVDTTGAGDAFNGAWLAGWLRGRTMAAALAQAALVAACCVETAGPRGYLSRLEEHRQRLPAAASASGTPS